MERRKFTKTSLAAGIGLSILPGASYFDMEENALLNSVTEKEVRAFLSKLLYTRQEVDDYFSGKAFPFSKHSPEFGWLLRDGYFRDGVNNSISVYTYAGSDGERLMSNYADQPCRINTYGNSFTQCHQVSDHETWQEVLAAHLQEPVRNFGIGGWSVYQAYLRMLKEEKRTPAEYLIFNIYGDDHSRNLDAWRNIRIHKHERFIEPPLPHLKVDLKNRLVTEHPNPTPSKEDFYRLCDIDEAYKLFKDDFKTQAFVAYNKAVESNKVLSQTEVQSLVEDIGMKTSIEGDTALSEIIRTYAQECTLVSTEKIVNDIEQFAKNNGKKVLYVLSYPASYISEVHKENKRWDQLFIDFLKSRSVPFVDLCQLHLEEFNQFNVPIQDYLNRYYIGHYNPLGNMFCAKSLVNPLVKTLTPIPIPYDESRDVMG